MAKSEGSKQWCLVQGISSDGRVIVGLDKEGSFCMAEIAENKYKTLKNLSFPSLYSNYVLQGAAMFPSCSFVSEDGNFTACVSNNKLHVWCKKEGIWQKANVEAVLSKILENGVLQDCVGFDKENCILLNFMINEKQYKLKVPTFIFPISRESVEFTGEISFH